MPDLCNKYFEDNGLTDIECGLPKQFNYEFLGDSCFYNSKYYGQIIEREKDKIKVLVNNGNKYMKGQIVYFSF